jgi:DNA-binding NarL/FixJ family response regulator
MTDLTAAAELQVLIVEDHPLFCAMLEQLINREIGMAACCNVDNVNDAMARIEIAHPDLAIVDLSLQGSSGIELLKILKVRNIQVPVMVLSMHEERLYAERVLRAGARGYISKLASPAEVVAAIRKVMAGEIYVSEHINGNVLEQIGCVGRSMSPKGIELLSNREIEVFQLLGRGLNSRDIGVQLNLGSTTVDSYRARIKEKLVIKNAAELYQRAAEWVAEGGL